MLLTLECVCWTAPVETLHSNGCRCRWFWLLKQIFVLRGKKVRGLHANHRWKCLLCIFPPEQLSMKRRPIRSGLFGVFLKRNRRDRRGDAGDTPQKLLCEDSQPTVGVMSNKPSAGQEADKRLVFTRLPNVSAAAAAFVCSGQTENLANQKQHPLRGRAHVTAELNVELSE